MNDYVVPLDLEDESDAAGPETAAEAATPEPVTVAQPAAPVAAPKLPNKPAALIDVAARTVTSEGVAYKLDDLKPEMQTRVALIGLRFELRSGKTFASLVAGDVRPVRVEKPTEKPLSNWQRAIVGALVESTKKAGANALDAAEAERRVRTLDKEKIASYRRNPLVVKHYDKITGAGASLHSLIEIPAAEPEVLF